MGERFRVDYLGEMRWGVIDTANGRLVGIDGGEPEDQLLCRDWKWVPEELNKLAARVAASDERIRELEAEAEKIRDTAVSIELVKVASVDLVQDADGRDRAVLSTSWGIGLHRQHNCDEEGCGCWHVIARPPLSVESRVALLDLRSAKDDAKRERDEARTRIATLERELAEARQRDEDATDLILRQGRELAAMRTKAEAAERFSMVVRHRKACLEQGKKWKRSSQWAAAVDAILAACPEKGGAL